MRSARWAWLVLAVVAISCAKPRIASTRRIPAGDGIWFEEGLAETERDVEATLVRAGFSWVFYPICRLSRGAEGWSSTPVPVPPRPFARLPVFLVVTADETVSGAFGGGEHAVTPLANAAWLAVKSAIRDAGRYGTIAGVHLDLPFSAAEAEAYAALVSDLRSKLPSATLLSVSLRFTPPPQAESLKALASLCDGLVAFVAGENAEAEPIPTDALERSWWAGFAPGARGVWSSAGGENRGAVPERLLARLTDDERVKLLQDLALKDTADSSFTLAFREPVTVEGFAFQRGDRLNFRLPILSEIVYHMGSDLAGRRFVRGRVLSLPGRSESERIFTLEALSEVLLGRPSAVFLHVAVEGGRGLVKVETENASPHASVISSTSNWVEVEIPTGGIREVQPGGFDRFEVFGPDRNPVTLGRATIIRFFETLFDPHEKIEPARIMLKGAPPKDCCAFHFRVLSASGQEVTSENPVPTPGK